MPESEDNVHILSKRLNKILGSRLENDPDTVEVLKELSTFYNDNTLQARRNLRSQIEKRSLAINENFLAAFREAKEAFDDVYNDVAFISRDIQEMINKLHNAKLQTKQLLDETAQLESEKKNNEEQLVISELFIKAFQLNSDDLLALYGNNQRNAVTLDIFKALEKVQKIHHDCKVLMQSGHQTLASNIMEQMTMHQERAVERLYRWAQYNCRNVENADFTETITKSMQVLQTRGPLFKYVIDEYSMFRRGVLESEFLNALTRGGPSGNPAPIEMRAHDPQIYITDMLAWLNKAIPIEKQKFNLLLSDCKQLEEQTVKSHVDNAFVSIFEGVCMPLKNRVDKILVVANQVETLYAVTNLLRYYKKKIRKFVVNGPLAECLPELEAKAEETFVGSLRHQIDGMLVRVEAPPRDLSPTSSINNILSLMRDILSTASMSEGRESDMVKIANIVLEPLLRAVNEQAARLPPTDMAVYMLNCMYAMYTCLSMYQYMDDRLERLQAQSEAQIDTLTSEQASSLVANLNLGPIYTILQDTSHGPLSLIPGMEPSNLSKFLGKLDVLVVKPESLLLPQISLLASSQHKKSVQRRSFEVLNAIYRELYQAVIKPENLYENPEEILTKTPDDLIAMMNVVK